jgi:hypothetical protein
MLVFEVSKLESLRANSVVFSLYFMVFLASQSVKKMMCNKSNKNRSFKFQNTLLHSRNRQYFLIELLNFVAIVLSDENRFLDKLQNFLLLGREAEYKDFNLISLKFTILMQIKEETNKNTYYFLP